jgi:hypothetical protein
MNMDEALRRGAAGLALRPGRLLAMARALAVPAPGGTSLAGAPPAGPAAEAAGDPAASRAALAASHALLTETIALLARPG